MDTNLNPQSNQTVINPQPIPAVELVQITTPPVQNPVQNVPPAPKFSKTKIFLIIFAVILTPILIAFTVGVISGFKNAYNRDIEAPAITENQNSKPDTSPKDGYTLQKCGNTDLSLQMPSGWFYKGETKGDTESCFITKENIDTNIMFETGISVNRLVNVSTKTTMSANEYAESLINKLETQETVNSATEVEKGGSIFPTFSRYVETDNFKAYYLTLVDQTNDTVYLIWFESPYASWEQELPKALEILSKIALTTY